jgi:hypothetical protein
MTCWDIQSSLRSRSNAREQSDRRGSRPPSVPVTLKISSLFALAAAEDLEEAKGDILLCHVRLRLASGPEREFKPRASAVTR